MTRQLLDRERVGHKLGHDGCWFLRNRKRLEARGFPPRVPETQRWDEAAIDAWLDRQMPAALRPAHTNAGAANDEGDDLEGERAAILEGLRHRR